MVPKVVGSNPIFHPKFESLAKQDFFYLYSRANLFVNGYINKKIVSETLSNFGSAPAASGRDGRYGAENLRSSQSHLLFNKQNFCAVDGVITRALLVQGSCCLLQIIKRVVYHLLAHERSGAWAHRVVLVWVDHHIVLFARSV